MGLAPIALRGKGKFNIGSATAHPSRGASINEFIGREGATGLALVVASDNLKFALYYYRVSGLAFVHTKLATTVGSDRWPKRGLVSHA